MIINHEAGFIFLAVNKTASSSIHTALREAGFPTDTIVDGGPRLQQHHHADASELRGLLTPDQWRTYFKFAFVRNPWDRLVSHYHYLRHSPWVHHDDTGARVSDTFRSWICGGRYPQKDQYSMLSCDGTIAMDFVGRYERIHCDFATVCKMLRVSVDLPHLNAHGQGHYHGHYDPVAFETTRPLIEVDAACFDYEFGT